VEVTIRDDAIWSDGEPITADDVEFTYDLVLEIDLHCEDLYGIVEADSPRTGVLGVQAVGESTVRITFNDEPGLGVWPHTIGIAPIMAEHFWTQPVADARSAGVAAVDAVIDPAATVWKAHQQAAEAAGEEFTKTVDEISAEEIDRYLAGVYHTTMTEALFAVSGVGDPSGGPMTYAGRTPGLEIRNVANPRYFRSGEVVESGGVAYEIGPFIDEQIFLIYDTTEDLVRALLNGEIDHALLPQTAAALAPVLTADPDTVALNNPANGFMYLGFNLRKPPMSDLAFRQAVAMMIDREFLTDEVSQNVLLPAWALLPEANLGYYDPEAGAGIASRYRNLDHFERLEAAVGILEEGGYTWEHEPSVGRDAEGEPFIEPGQGIMMPDGTRAPALEILNLGPGTGLVFFATLAAYIEHWLQDLGFSAQAQPSTGPLLVSEVWPGAGFEPTFDLYVLGWQLGNPAFPTLYDSFFHSRNLAESNDGNNSVGYVNPEFDALAEQIYQVTTSDEAKTIIWQLETILARDLPYVVVCNFPAREAVSSRLELPFTETLNGLLNATDFPGLVRIREWPGPDPGVTQGVGSHLASIRMCSR
jgi:ABC-type transport system substrate-binding protein